MTIEYQIAALRPLSQSVPTRRGAASLRLPIDMVVVVVIR